jgi:eukaryotic-like serine/threonine-protein kinase
VSWADILVIEQVISHYRVLEYLGAGGMGRVYRAKDLTLGREVALKFLPELSRDRAAVLRFQREAQSAAAVNHSNICTIYEVGEHEGTPFLAMELLHGEILSSRVSSKAVAFETILEWGIQITEALDAAHKAGIIHRDLKLSNLFITSRGQIKVLDFGLAKLKRSQIAAPILGDDATLLDSSDRLSTPGNAIGTPAYMSPEQAKGEDVDERSDLFSLGIVLYELATGRLPFSGKSSASVTAAILYESPEPPSKWNRSLPPRLDEVILKALEKDPDVRYQHAADLRADVKRLKRDFESGRLNAVATAVRAASERSLVRRFRWPMVGGAVGVVWIVSLLGRRSPPPMVTGTVQITNDPYAKRAPVLTDGSRIFFNSGNTLAPEPRQVSVAGGDSVPVPTPRYHMAIQDISPDHTQLLMIEFNGFGSPSGLWLTPTVAGPARRLGDLACDYAVQAVDLTPCAAFSPDGQQIAYVRGRELRIAGMDGVERRKLTSLPTRPSWPRWSPDGTRIRFSGGTPSGLWEIAADGSNQHRLFTGLSKDDSPCCGTWTADGRYFVFNSGKDLWAVRESKALIVRGNQVPTRLTFGPVTPVAAVPSLDGSRLYMEGYQPRFEFVAYDLNSRQVSSFLGGISAYDLLYSRDGRWVTYVTVPDGKLWRSAPDGTQRLQLTPTGFSRVLEPVFSPDASQIAFTRVSEANEGQIYVIPSNGGTPEAVTSGKGPNGGDWTPTWSPDGNSIAFGDSPFTAEQPSSNTRMVHLLDLKTRKISDVPNSQGMWTPHWSPTGRFLAGLSAPGWRVMLYDFDTQRQTELFGQRGGFPTWSPDGQFVYFTSTGEDQAWWRVRVRNRKLERVARMRDLRLRSDIFFSVAPDNLLITTRDVSSDQIYALEWKAP